MEPCKYAYYKPVDTLAGFINDLQSSIVTYKVLNPLSSTQAFATDIQYPQTDSDVYFTDRRYRQQHPYRPSPTRNPRSNSHTKVYPRRRTSQKCFVCGKEGCWSTRHTQEERDRSKKRFNKRINQFILEYEGEEAEESLNELIEALIINFNLDD